MNMHLYLHLVGNLMVSFIILHIKIWYSNLISYSGSWYLFSLDNFNLINSDRKIKLFEVNDEYLSF